jgi:hypothetical protein
MSLQGVAKRFQVQSRRARASHSHVIDVTLDDTISAIGLNGRLTTIQSKPREAQGGRMSINLKGLLRTRSMMLIAMLTIAASSALGSRFTPNTYLQGGFQLTAGIAPAPAAQAVIKPVGQTRFTEVAQNSTPRPSPHSARPATQTSGKKKILNSTTAPCTPPLPCPRW